MQAVMQAGRINAAVVRGDFYGRSTSALPSGAHEVILRRPEDAALGHARDDALAVVHVDREVNAFLVQPYG